MIKPSASADLAFLDPLRRVADHQQKEQAIMAKFMADMGLQPGQRVKIQPRQPPT
jgi:hypothetical protein